MVKKKEQPKWVTIKIPAGLFNRLDDYVESKTAYELGITSKSQAAAYILRQFFNETESVA